ncbi:hypothetical protein A6R68_16282, partial [Neotoma lepida]
PKEVRQLAEDFLTDYIHINIGVLELSANHNKDEKDGLTHLIKEMMHEETKTIDFVEIRRKCDELMRRDG